MAKRIVSERMTIVIIERKTAVVVVVVLFFLLTTLVLLRKNLQSSIVTFSSNLFKTSKSNSVTPINNKRLEFQKYYLNKNYQILQSVVSKLDDNHLFFFFFVGRSYDFTILVQMYIPRIGYIDVLYDYM